MPLGSQYPQTWCIACGRDVEQEKIHLEAAKKLVLERAQWQYKKMKKISEPAAKIVQAKGYIPIEMPGVVLLESDMPLFKAYVSTMVEYKHLDADITAASAQKWSIMEPFCPQPGTPARQSTDTRTEIARKGLIKKAMNLHKRGYVFVSDCVPPHVLPHRDTCFLHALYSEH